MSLGATTARVLNGIDTKIDAFAKASFEALTNPMSDLMALLMVLALIHLFASMAFGWTAATVSSVLRLVLRYAFVWGTLTSWPTFEMWFYRIVTGTPDDIVKAIISASGIDPDAKGITQIVERFIDAGISLGDDLIENISISTIALVLIGIVILFLMLVVSSSVILVIGISKIGIGVTTAVAPVFLAMLLWQTTRGFFEGWFRISIAFAVTYLMAMMMLGFLLFVTEETIERYATLDTVGRVADITEYLLIVILSIFMLRQIPGFGSAIAGSAVISIDGISKVTRGAWGAWNVGHGLRPDGRTRYAAENRRLQRQRLMGWGQRQSDRFKGSPDTPHEARGDAEAAARRKSAVDEARPEARKHLKGGEPSRSSWNKGIY